MTVKILVAVGEIQAVTGEIQAVTGEYQVMTGEYQAMTGEFLIRAGEIRNKMCLFQVKTPSDLVTLPRTAYLFCRRFFR